MIQILISHYTFINADPDNSHWEWDWVGGEKRVDMQIFSSLPHPFPHKVSFMSALMNQSVLKGKKIIIALSAKTLANKCKALGQEQDKQTRGRDTSDPWLRLYIYMCKLPKGYPLGCGWSLSRFRSQRQMMWSIFSHLTGSLSLSLSPCSPIVSSQKNKQKQNL